ncbi:MAG: Fe-S cluster assembly protein SufD [Flavisolibacter sp.]
MNMTEMLTKQFETLQQSDKDNALSPLREKAFGDFSRQGIPTVRHEEWKYTRVSGLFNKEYSLSSPAASFTADDLQALRLPGHDEANELVFVNGFYAPALSNIRSAEIEVKPLEEAANGAEKDFVLEAFGHSADYLKDGINALNTAFVHGGIFLRVKRGKLTEHPIYIYNIADARSANILAQPRSLMHVAENAQVQVVETYITLGNQESLTNQVIEVVVDQDARFEYYKIENDAAHANLVSTTHIHQRAKSYVHTVTISFNGNIVRNNLNMVMGAEHCEGHLYGLYFLHGKTHVDNHTLVDNQKPHCFSNEFYKGIMADQSTGIFNGKIFVRQDAQKINAYQSNKNILLSADATVNTKPQLEIFADDVKCSHGCTVGQLDEEALFYLRSRGVNENTARSLLVHGFAVDVLEHILPEAIRRYVDEIIAEKLDVDLHD